MHRLVQEPDGMMVLYVGTENWPFPILLASRGRRWFFDAKTGAEEILVRQIGEHEAAAIDACRSVAAAVPALGGDLDNEIADGYRFRVIDPEPARSGASRATRNTSSGKMITDARCIAYPVEYRSTGVMTFIVTRTGTVYQRDLGRQTSQVAQNIKGPVARPGWVLIPE